MKTRNAGLEVDFIGVQDSSLTPEEEKALSDFFARRKLDSNKTVNNNNRVPTKKLKTLVERNE